MRSFPKRIETQIVEADDSHVNCGSQLFHRVAELQRQRLEAELDLRRLDNEIAQMEYKINRHCKKLQVIQETIEQTEQQIVEMEEILQQYKENYLVQEAATTKLKNEISATASLFATIQSELSQLQEENKSKLARWAGIVDSKCAVKPNPTTESSGKREDI
jgi:chromosome segregation ATPase